ncbi:hypothetical protein FBU30_001787 [Linnemannia zychae]|nr:hypothetical protein FBU30_001787 [Linnemannia zychae]
MEITQSSLPSPSFTDDEAIAPFKTTISTENQTTAAPTVEHTAIMTQHATLEPHSSNSNDNSNGNGNGSVDTNDSFHRSTVATVPPLHSALDNKQPSPTTPDPKPEAKHDTPEISPSKPLSLNETSTSISSAITPSSAISQKLPDSDTSHTVSLVDKNTPYTILQNILTKLKERDDRTVAIASVMGGLVVVRYILPRIGWSTLFVGLLGMGFGGFIVAFYLLAVPEATRLKRASTVAKFGRHHDQRFEIVDGVPSWSDSQEQIPIILPLAEAKEADSQHVRISPDIDPMVEDMISYALRDFVNVPIGLVAEGQHNIPLRASLVAMAMNLANRFSNVRLPETALLAVFGVQNNFIVHLRAYRELRTSRLPIAKYVIAHANPDSVIGRCYHKEERLKQLRSTAKAICQALLSKGDQQSIALFAVMQEIMATHVLESTLEYICDPDFINLAIIDYFNTTKAEQKDEASVAGAVEAARPGSLDTKLEEAPITTLADSILMNAAHLMDKTSRNSPEPGPAIQKPTPQQTVPFLDTSAATAIRTPESPRLSTTSTPRSAVRSPLAPQEKHLNTPAQNKSPITLKDVLTQKSEHIDLYQEFMSYAQVWDAMDLVQFWVMIDIFHRQIEQGTFNNPEDLRREANTIFESYCGPDPDQQVTGICDAKGGAVLKNLRKNIRPNPAYCFAEPQEWAMGVLEQQYWEPFLSKREREAASKAMDVEAPQRAAVPEAAPEAAPRTSQAPIRSSSSSSLAASPTDLEKVIERTASPTYPSVPKISVQTISLTDMVNRRPKTLMSNSELSYMIEVQTHNGQGWMVTRTFQQLEHLQQALLQQFPIVQRSIFPRWRLQPSDKVCLGLQNFMRAMLAIPEVSDSMSLSWFLSKEFDQSPASVQEAGLFRSPTPSTSNPLAESGKAIGLAASQGAKTALRQASEASLSAGRFFKSIGAAVANGTNTVSSPQLTATITEDKNPRGSIDSVRSASSVFTLPDRSSNNGTGSPITPAPTPVLSNTHTMSVYDAEGIISDTPSRFSSTLSDEAAQLPINTSSSLLSPDPAILASPASFDISKFDHISPSPLNMQRLSNPSSSLDGLPIQPRSDLMSAPSSELVPTSPTVATTNALPSTPATSINTSTLSIANTPTAASTPSLYPKKKMPLLSNDELDLLIETSFTVLEDIMDFSKGQSIRRMTFGVLRELVRKSYRVAINQSFSTWVEQNTSHESMVEMVRWMKEDLLWPGGEWPVPPTPESMASLASSEAANHQEKKEIIRVGNENYEIGSDGIAVKVGSSSPVNTATATASAPAPAAPVPGARTEKEKEMTRDKARELVMMMLPGSLVTVLGKEAVLRGLVDVFEMMQIKELNLGLALSVLEMAVRLTLSR